MSFSDADPSQANQPRVGNTSQVIHVWEGAVCAFTSSRLLMETGQRQTSWTKIGTQFLSKSRSACGKFPVIAKPLAGPLILPILALGLVQESGSAGTSIRIFRLR